MFDLWSFLFLILSQIVGAADSVSSSNEMIDGDESYQETLLKVQENLRKCEASSIHRTWSEMSDEAKMQNCKSNSGLYQQVDQFIDLLKKGQDFSEVRGQTTLVEELSRLNLAILDASLIDLEAQVNTIDLILEQADFREKNNCETAYFIPSQKTSNDENGPNFSCEKTASAVEFWGNVDALSDLHERIKTTVSTISNKFLQLADFMNHQYNTQYGTNLPVKDPSFRPKCWPDCQVTFEVRQQDRGRTRVVQPKLSIAEDSFETFRWLIEEFRLNDIDLPFNFNFSLILSDVLSEQATGKKRESTNQVVTHRGKKAQLGWQLEQRIPPTKERLKEILRERREELSGFLGFMQYRAHLTEKNLEDHYLALSDRGNIKSRADRSSGKLARTREYAEEEFEFLLAALPETAARIVLASPEFSGQICNLLQNLKDRERAQRLQSLFLDGAGLGLTLFPLGRAAAATFAATRRPLATVSQWISATLKKNLSPQEQQARMVELLKATKNLRLPEARTRAIRWLSSKDAAQVGSGLALGGFNSYQNYQNAQKKLEALAIGAPIDRPKFDRFITESYSFSTAQQEELRSLTIDILATPSRSLSLYRGLLPFLETTPGD